jgi:uncharacterized protein YcbX
MLVQIYRYPVKGLPPEPLEAIALAPGCGLPWDRHFAIAHGASRFDRATPSWQRKGEFVQLVRAPRLARLDAVFDPATGILSLAEDGEVLVTAATGTAEGLRAIEMALECYLGPDERGRPQLAEAAGIMFSDVDQPWISLINRATLRDLSARLGHPMVERRFRGNLVIDGDEGWAEPWAELDWVGRMLQLGTVRLEVMQRIGRCVATAVDPATGERDLPMPKALQEQMGHPHCGIYLRVVEGGEIRLGDRLSLIG